MLNGSGLALALAVFTAAAPSSAQPLPRVAVVAQCLVDGKPADASILSQAANELLLNGGFPTVAPEQLRAVSQTLDFEGALAGKVPQELSALDVDLLLLLRGSADELTGKLSASQRSRIFSSNVSATVVRVDTARIAFTRSAKGHAADLAAATAGARSLEKALAGMGNELLGALKEQLSKVESVELAVYGLEQRGLLRELLARLEQAGLGSATERYFGGGLARLELQAHGGRELADRLEAARLPLEIIATSATRVGARYAPTANLKLTLHAFPVQGRERFAGWVPEAVEELLSLRLSQLGYLEFSQANASPELSKKLNAGDAAAMRAYASEAGADAVLFSELRKEGSVSRLSVRILGKKGETLASASASGPPGDPAELVGQALRELETTLPRRLGASRPPGKAPSLVLEATIEELFLAQLNRYAQKPALTLRLRAEGALPFENVRVRATLPGLMTLPTELDVGTVPAGQKRELGLSLALDPKAAAQITQGYASGLALALSYRVDGLDGTEDRILPVVIHSGDAIDWRVPSSAAAFVTPADPAVRGLASAAVKLASSLELPPSLRSPVLIHETLTGLSMRYVKDPVLAWGSTPLDTVQLPSRTLTSGAGDCDDLTALYAALLESIGVPAALLLTPGHILLAFDTGLPPGRRSALSLEPSRLVEREGTLWIPLEATALSQSFFEAWEAGARELTRHREKLQWVELRSAWAEYPPAPSRSEAKAPEIDLERLGRRAGDAVSLWREHRKGQAEALVSRLSLAKKKSPETLAQLVGALALSGKLDEAVAAAGNTPRGASLLHRGNAHLLAGRIEPALADFSQAAGEVGARASFNAGLAHYRAGRREEAKREFSKAALGGLSGELERFFDKRDTSTRAAEAKQERPVLDADLAAVLQEALKQVPKGGQQKPRSEEDKVLSNAGRRGEDRLAQQELSGLLYWEL